MQTQSYRIPRATITEERIKFLHKLFPKAFGLFRAAQNWRAAITDAERIRAANAVRRYIPDALNLIWIAQDATKSREHRRAFNPIRLTVVA